MKIGSFLLLFIAERGIKIERNVWKRKAVVNQYCGQAVHLIHQGIKSLMNLTQKYLFIREELFLEE